MENIHATFENVIRKRLNHRSDMFSTIHFILLPVLSTFTKFIKSRASTYEFQCYLKRYESPISLKGFESWHSFNT